MSLHVFILYLQKTPIKNPVSDFIRYPGTGTLVAFVYTTMLNEEPHLQGSVLLHHRLWGLNGDPQKIIS